MAYNPCSECSGEDCVCCEVWLERQADIKAAAERDPYEEEYSEDYNWDNHDWENDPDWR